MIKINDVFIKNAKDSSGNIKINRFVRSYLFINRLYECKDEIV